MNLTAQQVFDNYLLVDAYPLADGRIAVGALSHPAKRDGIFISQILYYDGHDWTKGKYFGWEVVSVAPSLRSPAGVYLLGREGDCVEIVGDSVTAIPEPQGQPPIGPFRRLCNTGTSLHLLGEDRAVWVLDGADWKPMVNGLPQTDPTEGDPDDEEFIDALLAETEVMFGLAGRSPAELCMVGTNGEVWLWDGKIWSRDELATNVNFYDVSTFDDSFLICGQQGALYQGHSGLWRDLCPDVDNDFCSVDAFGGFIYVADGEGLYALDSGGLSRVDFGVQQAVPSHRVVAANGRIVSIAAKELFHSTDGVAWTSALL